MNIPPFWARNEHQGLDAEGRRQSFAACGWSFTSLQEAKAQAMARARRIFDAITCGRKPESYQYHDRPVKEEIVDEIRDGDALIAVVTRNRYGALVLNTANVLFADVDFPKARPSGLFEMLAMLLSRKRRESKRRALIEQTTAGIQRWAERNPDRSFRLYRTREGFRLLFTDRLYDPTSAPTRSLLEQLHTDPMYLKLTQKQECFRARLTAKPWRCGCSRPPNAYPWADAQAEQAYRQWQAAYTKIDAGYKVCELIREFGPMADIEAVRRVVQTHDHATRVDAQATLA